MKKRYMILVIIGVFSGLIALEFAFNDRRFKEMHAFERELEEYGRGREL